MASGQENLSQKPVQQGIQNQDPNLELKKRIFGEAVARLPEDVDFLDGNMDRKYRLILAFVERHYRSGGFFLSVFSELTPQQKPNSTNQKITLGKNPFETPYMPDYRIEKMLQEVSSKRLNQSSVPRFSVIIGSLAYKRGDKRVGYHMYVNTTGEIMIAIVELIFKKKKQTVTTKPQIKTFDRSIAPISCVYPVMRYEWESASLKPVLTFGLQFESISFDEEQQQNQPNKQNTEQPKGDRYYHRFGDECLRAGNVFEITRQRVDEFKEKWENKDFIAFYVCAGAKLVVIDGYHRDPNIGFHTGHNRSLIQQGGFVIIEGNLKIQLPVARDTQTQQPSASTGQSPTSTGQSPTSTGQSPTSTGQSPTSTGQSPTSTGQSPTSTGQSPTSTGQSPTSTGQSPTSTGQSPTSTGQSPTSTGQSPTSTGQSPTSTEEDTVLGNFLINKNWKVFCEEDMRKVSSNALNKDVSSKPVIFLGAINSRLGALVWTVKVVKATKDRKREVVLIPPNNSRIIAIADGYDGLKEIKARIGYELLHDSCVTEHKSTFNVPINEETKELDIPMVRRIINVGDERSFDVKYETSRLEAIECDRIKMDVMDSNITTVWEIDLKNFVSNQKSRLAVPPMYPPVVVKENKIEHTYYMPSKELNIQFVDDIYKDQSTRKYTILDPQTHDNQVFEFNQSDRQKAYHFTRLDKEYQQTYADKSGYLGENHPETYRLGIDGWMWKKDGGPIYTEKSYRFFRDQTQGQPQSQQQPQPQQPQSQQPQPQQPQSQQPQHQQTDIQRLFPTLFPQPPQ